jgi:uncharacterized protein (DUF433 family)
MGLTERISSPRIPTVAGVEGVMGGQPCVEGTRVLAETILVSINDGESVFEIYRSYPYLPFGAVEAVVLWAQKNGRDILLPVRRMPDA